MTPLQMKGMVTALAGIMNSTAKRLSMRVKDFVVAGGDIEQVRPLLDIAESLPEIAQRLIDYAYGTRHLPESTSTNCLNENNVQR